MQPVVGISCYITEATWGPPRTDEAALLPSTYVRVLHRVGAVPVLLPTSPADGAGQVAGRLDALLLSGGGDVDPARFGAAAHAATSGIAADHDRWEFGLLESALARDLPVLGICRGAQVLNVARGGDIDQHLPDTLGHDRHLPGPVDYWSQQLKVDAASTMGTALGATADGRCHHHQGFGQLGEDVRPVAWAEDGIVEGIELAGHRFVVGAQWHPERTGDDRLFGALVAAAGR